MEQTVEITNSGKEWSEIIIGVNTEGMTPEFHQLCGGGICRHKKVEGVSNAVLEITHVGCKSLPTEIER